MEKPVVEKEFPGLEEALESVVRELRLEKQAVIAENADEGVEDIISYETAAVIARTADEARETYYILKEKLEAEGFDTKERLSLLHRDSTNFQKGLTVTTFYMAKGVWSLIRYFLYFLGKTEVRSWSGRDILRRRELFMNCICMKL